MDSVAICLAYLFETWLSEGVYLNIGMGLFDIINYASYLDQDCRVKSGKRTILELINNVAFA